MACHAPQTRKFWMEQLERYGEAELRKQLAFAESGLERHGESSTRHRHDWTIYRACCIRELRRRGLM